MCLSAAQASAHMAMPRLEGLSALRERLDNSDSGTLLPLLQTSRRPADNIDGSTSAPNN